MPGETILNALKNVIPPSNGAVGLHEPHFQGREWEYVKQCLDTAWVSYAGAFVDRLEKDLAEYTGARRAVVMVNGTTALMMALLVCGVGPEDEVLMPSLTFVATANAVSHLGAVPHFVDSEERTLGMAPAGLGDYLDDMAVMRSGQCYNRLTGRRLAAVIPVHVFGHPVDLEALEQVCERFQLPMIEDAAEGLGSTYKGRHVGTWGRAAVLSFNGNKIITTGGGGALLTGDDEIADRAGHLSTTAKVRHPWNFYHDAVGYNFRMPNINAALGCAQLEQLPLYINKKRRLAQRYQEELAGAEGMAVVSEPEGARSNYWLNAVLLDREHKERRDEVIESAHRQGYQLRPAWTPLHKLKIYESHPRMDLPGCEDLADRLINLPSSVFL